MDFGTYFLLLLLKIFFWNYGDFFFLDWWLHVKYTDRIMVLGTEDNELWEIGSWMKKFGIVDHWVRGPIICAQIGMLIR